MSDVTLAALPDALTAVEHALWEGYATGAWVEHADREPVRGALISALLLGLRERQPGHVPAVRLRGCRITGKIDVAGGAAGCALELADCDLDEAPDFSFATVPALRIRASRLPGLHGLGLRCDGRVNLSDSTVAGPLRLQGAHLRGGLDLNSTTIERSDLGWALLGGGLVVDNGLFARGLTVRGATRLTGARMTGGLFLEGATLHNPDGLALQAESIIVDDAMECSRGFTAEGTIRLRGARINGALSFDQAVLRSPERALHLTRLVVDELILTPAEPIEGRVNLGYARIGVLLLDDPRCWPQQVELAGCTYESIRGPVSLPALIDWVGRSRWGFRPQPYEELAAWFRRAGHDDLASRTLLAKHRARRRSLGPGGRLWGLLLDWAVGYGFRPWLAGVWLAVLLGIGTVAYSIEQPRLVDVDERRTFNAFAYTLDLLNPLGTFGQRTAWEPKGFGLWLAYGLIAAGWVLATALVAGVTRVLRRT